MSGYTPVFSSIYDGTLYGKWPAAAVFATLLPLADAKGNIDMSMEAISGRTGWPPKLLKLGIEQLCEPDNGSRSAAHDGRRLTLLDPNRPWGWHVVNHEIYREKARLQAKSAREVAEGKNAARMSDRRRPPETAADPLSNSNSNSNTGLKTTAYAVRSQEAMQVWPKVHLAIKGDGDLRKTLGEGVRKAVQKMGGWQTLGMRPEAKSEWTRKEFIETYAGE